MSTLLSPVTSDDISRGLEKLGLAGACAEIHASLSSFGRVQGGAHTVARALTQTLDTVLAPAFCWDASCPPPLGAESIQRNAMGQDYLLSLPAHPKAFDPAASPIDRAMGEIPKALRAFPESKRSAHPLNSWVASGARASFFTSPYGLEDPYRPLKRLEEVGGFVLLLGVGLNSCTALHLAEERADRKIFIRWAAGSGGEILRVRTGTCSRGFDNLNLKLWPLGREIRLGNARAWAVPIAALEAAAVEEIRKNPRITVCGPACVRCQDAAAGGPREN